MTPFHRLRSNLFEASQSPANLPFAMESGATTPSELGIHSFLLSFPFTISTDEPNNIWMKDLSPQKRQIDKQKAYLQFLDFYQYLASSSLVYLLPSTPGAQDQSYTANIGCVLPHRPEKKEFVLANFKSEPRKIEEAPGRAFMENMGYKVLQPDFTWEGEADLKYLRENLYIGGYGIRTDPKVYDWFQKQFDMRVIPIEMTDEYLYHFDCMFFPLDDESAIVCTELLSPKDKKALEKEIEIIDVSADDAAMGICNSLRLGDLFLSADLEDGFDKGSKEWEHEIHKQGTIDKICVQKQLEPVLFDLWEFTKSGALLSCLVCHLNYPDYDKGYN